MYFRSGAGFVACIFLHLKLGLTIPNYSEFSVKKNLLKNSNEAVLVNELPEFFFFQSDFSFEEMIISVAISFYFIMALLTRVSGRECGSLVSLETRR